MPYCKISMKKFGGRENENTRTNSSGAFAQGNKDCILGDAP
jgi:hypothetical protein